MEPEPAAGCAASRSSLGASGQTAEARTQSPPEQGPPAFQMQKQELAQPKQKQRNGSIDGRLPVKSQELNSPELLSPGGGGLRSVYMHSFWYDLCLSIFFCWAFQVQQKPSASSVDPIDVQRTQVKKQESARGQEVSPRSGTQEAMSVNEECLIGGLVSFLTISVLHPYVKK